MYFNKATEYGGRTERVGLNELFYTRLNILLRDIILYRAAGIDRCTRFHTSPQV